MRRGLVRLLVTGAMGVMMAGPADAVAEPEFGALAILCDGGGSANVASISCYGTHSWWNVYRAKVTCLSIQSGSYIRYGTYVPLHISPGSTMSTGRCNTHDDAASVDPQYGRR
jgi:hypothetical protein